MHTIVLLVLQLDHDYLKTERAGTFIEEFDRFCEEFPQMREFLDEYHSAKAAEKALENIYEKGLILSLDLIKTKNSLFQYYTGLPSFDVFSALFDYLDEKTEGMQYVSTAGQAHNADIFKSKPGPRRALSKMDEFFSTLVRLRLGLPSKHCARLFGVAESTYSVIFNTWVIVLCQRVGEDLLYAINRENFGEPRQLL